MSTPEETFKQECDDLLTTMEDVLLQMEKEPENPDFIASVFRSMHTIKGTSGVFGFDDVVSFTHIMENLLDKMRDGEISANDELIALLLECADHTKILVEHAINNTPISAESKEKELSLRGLLCKYIEVKEFVPELDEHDGEDSEDGEQEVGPTVETAWWHISLRFDTDVLQNGMDPSSFLMYLNKIGSIDLITTMFDRLPIDDSFNPEDCYLGFEINYSCSQNKQKIEQVFEFVRDMCKIHILSPKASINRYARVISDLPESNMALGEILVASGALTLTELDEVLEEQERLVADESSGEDIPKLEELLVENNLIHKELVDVALKKQTGDFSLDESDATSETENNKENNLPIETKTQNVAVEKSKFVQPNRILKVDAEKLDVLINLVGELVIAGATTNMLANRINDETLIEAVSSVSHLVEEIRDSALNLRMVQIGETFSRFKRVVRDVSKDLGKEIDLSINGAETELDKTVVERISDPLMHLVRNAMDHGIEQGEDRLKSGKSENGNLSLNAFHDSGFIVIEVKDDGRGLDKEKILAKALDRNLISSGQVLSDHEIYKLIFEPGFSTAETVTNLSGRGVGMDVVKQNIHALRGTVDVDSEMGKGSTVSIRLPLTLAIIDGFLVKVGDSSYVIPLDMVHECIDLSEEDDVHEQTQGYINLRGEVLPFIRLRDYFKEEGKEPNHKSIVVVQCGDHKAGFVVDELLGELQTVIKPLGKILQNLKGVSGATILGSGAVAVIIDVPNLIQRATRVLPHVESNINPSQSSTSLH